MEFILIKENCLEWEYMWDWVGSHPLNLGLAEPSTAINPESQEQWQYLGSYRLNDTIIHEFRHLDHPITHARQVLKVNGSANFTPEHIQKQFKI